jgi:hypothetical protein
MLVGQAFELHHEWNHWLCEQGSSSGSASTPYLLQILYAQYFTLPLKLKGLTLLLISKKLMLDWEDLRKNNSDCQKNC